MPEEVESTSVTSHSGHSPSTITIDAPIHASTHSVHNTLIDPISRLSGTPINDLAGLFTLLHSGLGVAPERASTSARGAPPSRHASRYSARAGSAGSCARRSSSRTRAPQSGCIGGGDGAQERGAQDIACDAAGFWRTIVRVHAFGNPRSGGMVVVDVGPIEHRDPCIGYVIREEPRGLSPATPVPRKIVVLRNTPNLCALVPLIHPTLPRPNEPAANDRRRRRRDRSGEDGGS
ncbi:hypothetical protein WOLCODRAFT_167771 [Wolfiporia cocos MD-104 SS10]|uniref:Uncharacterized protein n=1 Tax=Wolfiporia cocos (strain MD-104) TaxID=742152 RepID=A0A2H3J9U0_WOLCO|nr:hypothetical protein WOLCODRAFT_167771 [Wolfiporia cocos MD-104 SS10]